MRLMERPLSNYDEEIITFQAPRPQAFLKRRKFTHSYANICLFMSFWIVLI
jgi:hypothetical protein